MTYSITYINFSTYKKEQPYLPFIHHTLYNLIKDFMSLHR